MEIIANIPTNAALRLKVEELSKEFEAMEARITELEEENDQLRKLIPQNEELHEVELAILKLFSEYNELNEAHISELRPRLYAAVVVRPRPGRIERGHFGYSYRYR